jgi:hypothetical protein
MAFQMLYIYDYVITLCRQQTKVVQIHENTILLDTGKSEVRHRKYKRLELGGGQAYVYDRPRDKAAVVT